MSDSIKVLIADDIKETRENIKMLLDFDERIEVVGQAEDGDMAVKKAKELNPDIILMDINMPVKDGLQATEEISVALDDCSIIIISVQGEQEYMRKAMTSGAKEYIVKPFTQEDLVQTIIRVYENHQKRRVFGSQSRSDYKSEDSKVITTFSTKGGVGRTTISVNLAIAIARITEKRVALVDLNLRFGDITISLNLYAKKTISDLVEEIGLIDEELLEEYLIRHFSGIKILPAPLQPQLAEYITEEHVIKVIQELRKRYDYVIIDTPNSFEDYLMSVLDMSDTVLYILTPDIYSIKNTKVGLDIMAALGYDDEKIKVVINKASEMYAIKFNEIQNTLNTPIFSIVPEDNQTVITYANKGYPFVLGRSERKISKAVIEMAQDLTGKTADISRGKSIVARFFSF